MLGRLISKSSYLRLLTLISPKPHLLNPKPIPPKPSFFPENNNSHFFSTHNNNNGKDDFWKLSSQTEEQSVFNSEETVEGIEKKVLDDVSWAKGEEESDNVFKEDKCVGVGGGEEKNWTTAEGYKPWTFDVEGEGEPVFDIKVEETEMKVFQEEGPKVQAPEEKKLLELEEKSLTEVLKGPNRAFGDLIAASGITEEMMDSLLALRDLDGIQGLPPLREIEEMRYEKNTRKSSRADIERQKQEEVAKARVKQVDEKGRAYGTGRRKCSIARVWVEPGSGKVTVNDKEFDIYFPMLDHRAVLLRPFTETKTLGLWDVRCTVKGGGVRSGQVGAIQLGISRALQNWDPELRPPLREGGYLTRDSRVVERKSLAKPKQERASNGSSVDLLWC
ncbi:unnamed protein product [Withania somnifera]